MKTDCPLRHQGDSPPGVAGLQLHRVTRQESLEFVHGDSDVPGGAADRDLSVINFPPQGALAQARYGRRFMKFDGQVSPGSALFDHSAYAGGEQPRTMV